MRAGPDCELVDFDERYGDAFYRLNCEWLDAFFEVEPIDREVLLNPRESIIAPGGAILYLLLDGEVVGTAALKPHAGSCFELTKMAVTPGHQGCGLGRRLLAAAIEKFKDLGGRRLYLESHSSLFAALKLYESAGFRHETPPQPSEYARADVYMVYDPNAADAPT